ncbi:MAG: radical SAM protein, partial [Lachnospiraceae bacterium]|nr:radical SAM protein [Lachnospiraceae bacterium]
MINLNSFLNKGIKNIADIAGHFYIGNVKGRTFILRLVTNLKSSAKIREQYEQKGIHIPPFLIASIASQCNLHCSGCYAYANQGCGGDRQEELSLDDWQRIFSEAAKLGVSFILLAGGEPLLRRDLIQLAAHHPQIVFPVFTNGTMIDDEYQSLFSDNRNLIPVISIEGDEAQTDRRRGEGIARQIVKAMASLKEKGILYGTSITVTTENQADVTTGAFLANLREQGCGLVFYIEYVPAEAGTDHLVLNDEELRSLQLRIEELRHDRSNRGMILLSFPGDEVEMGGCLAAGRGFFHINANGGAEPCPFSPFAEMNLKEQTILQVLQSSFFAKIRAIGAAEALNHKGGCTLFEHREEVAERLAETQI